MVTKSVRMQSRRTSTAGKVFSSSELLEGEIAINLADRKLYSKDTGGNVFQVAGEAGRDAGKYVAFENFLGSGFQGVGVKDGGRVWFRRDNDKESDFTNVWITRAPRAFAGPSTGTVHALRVETKVDFTTKQFEWNAAFILQVNAAGGGEHCATYSQAVKTADGTAWAICLENRDSVQAPTTGTVTMEAGLFVKGDDPYNKRIGIHMALNAADSQSIAASGGLINKVGSALVIGGPSTHVRAGDLITLQGDAEVGLNFCEMDMGYHDVGIALLPNMKLTVKEATAVAGNGARTRGTERANLLWSSSFQTWAFGGMKSQINVGALLKYMNIVLDGQEYLIPLYAKP